VAERAVLGLGSNLGDREGYLRQAIKRLTREDVVQLVAASSIYQTPPLEVPAPQDDYLNQVVVVSTLLTAQQLLRLCQEVEVELGRSGNHPAGGPRTIDIDLITYGSLVHNSRELVIPHPGYTGRKFVLVPLAEVLPGFRDPATGHTIQGLLRDCQDTSIIQRWESFQEEAC